jgi:predicted HTH transcriptional regulator
VVNRINSRCKNVEVFTGPLIAMVDRAEGFISVVLSDGSYPVGAIYEAIENAAAYRDYFDVFHEITVLILKGSIHVISPGSLMGGAGVISGSNLPVRRNMWLYQRLMAVDEKNRFLQTGLGFKRMRQAFKGRGRVRFINVEDKNLFKVIFPGLEILK